MCGSARRSVRGWCGRSRSRPSPSRPRRRTSRSGAACKADGLAGGAGFRLGPARGRAAFALFTHTLIIWMSIFIVPMRLGESRPHLGVVHAGVRRWPGSRRRRRGSPSRVRLARRGPLPAMLFSHWHQQLRCSSGTTTWPGDSSSAELEQARRLRGHPAQRLRRTVLNCGTSTSPCARDRRGLLFVPEADEDTPPTPQPVYGADRRCRGTWRARGAAVNRLHGELTRLFGVHGRAGGRRPSARGDHPRPERLCLADARAPGRLATGLCFASSDLKGGGLRQNVQVSGATRTGVPARSRTARCTGWGDVHNARRRRGEQFECEIALTSTWSQADPSSPIPTACTRPATRPGNCSSSRSSGDREMGRPGWTRPW